MNGLLSLRTSTAFPVGVEICVVVVVVPVVVLVVVVVVDVVVVVVIVVVVGTEVGATQSKSLQGQPVEQFSLIKFYKLGVLI